MTSEKKSKCSKEGWIIITFCGVFLFIALCLCLFGILIANITPPIWATVTIVSLALGGLAVAFIALFKHRYWYETVLSGHIIERSEFGSGLWQQWGLKVVGENRSGDLITSTVFVSRDYFDQHKEGDLFDSNE